ncbi:NINE protein [Inhella sp.]|uniref:NINE protein n=1 Tax=Inhella sp. TaxID=1921806 RepID=UPI0035B1FD04
MSRSKAGAAWLAVLLGALGAHRFYLHGFKDRWAHLHWLATLTAIWGLRDLERLGTDAPNLSWALPLGCAMLAAGALQGIVLALSSDERWEARFGQANSSNWGSVLAAVFGLLTGGIYLMTAIVYAAQRYFELNS